MAIVANSRFSALVVQRYRLPDAITVRLSQKEWRKKRNQFGFLTFFRVSPRHNLFVYQFEVIFSTWFKGWKSKQHLARLSGRLLPWILINRFELFSSLRSRVLVAKKLINHVWLLSCAAKAFSAPTWRLNLLSAFSREERSAERDWHQRHSTAWATLQGDLS